MKGSKIAADMWVEIYTGSQVICKAADLKGRGKEAHKRPGKQINARCKGVKK